MENQKPTKFNLYKFLSTVSIIGIFVTVAIGIMAITGALRLTTTSFPLVASIAILCIGGVFSLYWARHLQNGKFKVLSIVFLSLIAACCVLWIVCVVLGTEIFKGVKAGDVETIGRFTAMLVVIKVSVITTLQFLVANLIAIWLLKYKYSLIPFQVVMYASSLFVDFYLTYLICCFVIKENGNFGLSDSVSFLTGKAMLTLFILMVVYIMLSNMIVKGIEMRRTGRYMNRRLWRRSPHTSALAEAVDDMVDDKEEVKEIKSEATTSVEEKIRKLNSLLQNNLISQEEYDKKKAEILENI